MEESLDLALLVTAPERTVTDESLRELMQVPKYEMLSAAIDRGVIKEKTDYVGDYKISVTPEIDFEAFKQLDYEIYHTLEPQEEATSEKSPPPTPEEEQYVRGLLQEAIDILYTMEITNRDTIVTASKFGGPGNIHIQPDLELLGLFNTTEYAKFHEASSGPFDVLPAPTRKIRDTYMEFLVGSKKLEDLIQKHVAELKRVGIEATEEKVKDITTMMVVSHEYGHAIDRGFLSKRRTTFGLAGNLPNTSLVDTLRRDNFRVHMEHFARGVQDIVTRQFTRELYPHDPEKAQQIVDTLNHFTGKQWKDCETFLLYMQDQGKNPSLFVDSNALMVDQVTEHLSRFYARGIANTLEIAQYAAPFYTRQQMNYLIHTLES